MAESNKNQTAAERARLKEALGAQLTDHICASPTCPTRPAESVRSAISMGIEDEIAAHKMVQEAVGLSADNYVTEEYLEELHGEMLAAAANLEFERAAQIRDRIAQLQKELDRLRGELAKKPEPPPPAFRFYLPTCWIGRPVGRSPGRTSTRRSRF